MIVVLFGPPGSGKGTQSEKLVEKYHLVHLSTGALLRREITQASQLGLSLQGILDRGELVPDTLMTELLFGQLKRYPGQALLLDGFPRTRAQAEALQATAPVDLALVLSAPLDLVLERLSGRILCHRCGATYHRSHNPAREAGVCDRCHGPLSVRPDDQPEIVRQRYSVYLAQTQAALAFYQNSGKMRTVDGARSPNQVFQELCQAVDLYKVNA